MPLDTADPWYALGDPTRRRVFARVVQRPTSVSAIARDLPVSRPAVSQHLRVLLDAHLVAVHQQGRERLYRARPEGLEVLRSELESFWTQALTTFRQVAERSFPSTESSEGDKP